MGSSFEGNGKSIDPSVGGLVWVRRRNGSWWPGRILGPDELPESCLVSPRSGTPVKLLGREDASVDWYNLEKSKRVKAFRCGEYDECIEKAKVSASVSVSSKKAVKYARREDAILHALEIERSRISKSRQQTEKSGSKKKPNIAESPVYFHPEEEAEGISDKLSGLEYLSNSPPELSQGGRRRTPNDSELSQGGRRRTPNDSELSQGGRRRTPNDSELSQGGRRRTPNDSESSQGGRRRTPNDSELSQGRRRRTPSDSELSQGGRRGTPNDSEEDGIEGSKKRMRGLEDIGIGGNTAVKRRRSPVAHVHEFLKKKNTRRQLTKVLESTAMVTVQVMSEKATGGATGSLGQDGSDNNKVSGLECNESKRSFSVVINNNNSDSSTGDASNNVFLTNGKQKENEISSISELAENDSSTRLFDVPFIGEEKQTADVSPISEKPQAGAGPQSGQSSLVETVSAGHDEIQESGSVSSGAAGLNEISHRIDHKGTSKWKHKGKRNSRNKSKNIPKFLDTNVINNDKDTDMVPLRTDNIEQVIEGQTLELTAPQRLLPYRQSRFTVNPKYESSDLSYRKHDIGCLYDVNIEVQTGHRTNHVPYISLMSKLTGQPIIGHPIVVEILENGVSDLSLNGSECHSSSCELDGDLGNWVQIQETRGRGTHKKPRRNGILSNKKIRKLSSLTGSKRPNEMGKFKKPGLACVPLKVVFGRINAALGINSTQSEENFGDAGPG